ncbi:MAG TPA: Glu/Leu/Phe/Val dehydrogenase dimerization domain-containing protein [Conexibacter sp.]|nr:Glu/Leu/Phe/Val dehydrogenase dimerization domain-containing protein [Conexibacter sp.]
MYVETKPRSERRGPRVERLRNVDGLIVYDIPSAPVSGGGTRLAPDVTEAEMRLLARAMSYKLAVLGLPIGGAKIGLRASPELRGEVIDGYRDEIAPRLASGALMTGPDLGTSEQDFVGLPTPGGEDGIVAAAADGVPGEELLTGCGVAAALAAALGGDLAGRTLALEGFGKMGASIARAVDRRGARIVAVSTVAGCAIAPPGRSFPLDQLLEARHAWGDDMVFQLGVPLGAHAALWAVACDALVPGARAGVLGQSCAARVEARVVVPVGNAPYTAAGLEVLRSRGVAAHADFVASAGGAMAYLNPRVAQAHSLDEAQEALEETMGALVRETLADERGPYAGAVAIAERFLRSWLPVADRPAGPPLAKQ